MRNEHLGDFDMIFEMYVEDQINEAIESNSNTYEAYRDYLMAKTSFYIDKNLRDVIIYLIQYVILVSNKLLENEGNNIIEASQSSVDVFMLLNNILSHNDLDEDIDECMDIAFETFKIPEYINHEEEIRREFPKYFLEEGIN